MTGIIIVGIIILVIWFFSSGNSSSSKTTYKPPATTYQSNNSTTTKPVSQPTTVKPTVTPTPVSKPVVKTTPISQPVSQPQTNQHRANRLALQETGTQYATAISNVLQTNPRFWNIYEYNISQTQNLTFGEIWQPLENGVVIINDHHTLIKYITCYGGHHYQKLQTSFVALFPHITANSNIDIVDYGCGQALATTVFYDYMLRSNKNFNVNKITLIEPSDLALKRGILKLNHFINHKQQNTEVKKVNKKLDDLTEADLTTNNTSIKIHLFSNILDVTSFDLNRLATKIKNSQKGLNYFVCVSPYNETAPTRIQNFQSQFSSTSLPCQSEKIYKRVFDIRNKVWNDTYGIAMSQKIFKCNFATATTRANNFDIDDDLPF
jgi:hypothetical protein